jgi:hypothetical protein
MPLTDAVILAPNSVDRNLIQPANDSSNGLVIESASATYAGALLQARTAGGVNLMSIGDPSAGFQLLSFLMPDGVNGTMFSYTTGNTDNPFQFIMGNYSAFDGSGNYYGEMYLEHDASLLFWHPTAAPGNDRKAGALRHGMLDNTHTSWKGRLFLTAFDSGGERTFLTGEADGTAARIGFLGAAAVVRQVGASAAAIAAITDPNAKAAIQALQTALANLGLVTSPA